MAEEFEPNSGQADDEVSVKNVVIVVVVVAALIVGLIWLGNATEAREAEKAEMEIRREQIIAEELERQAEEKRKKEFAEEIERRAAEEAEAAFEAAVDAKRKDPATYQTGLTYDDLARFPEEHNAKYLILQGKIVQALEPSGGFGTVRVAVGGDYDRIMVVHYETDIVQGRILEDDSVTFYAQSAGLRSYESVSGSTITIPTAMAYMAEVVPR